MVSWRPSPPASLPCYPSVFPWWPAVCGNGPDFLAAPARLARLRTLRSIGTFPLNCRVLARPSVGNRLSLRRLVSSLRRSATSAHNPQVALVAQRRGPRFTSQNSSKRCCASKCDVRHHHNGAIKVLQGHGSAWRNFRSSMGCLVGSSSSSRLGRCQAITASANPTFFAPGEGRNREPGRQIA